jgi:hypothetical protein
VFSKSILSGLILSSLSLLQWDVNAYHNSELVILKENNVMSYLNSLTHYSCYLELSFINNDYKFLMRVST